MNSQKYWQVALVSWCISMWVLSTIPLSLPEVANGDKIGHFVSYALLAWLACHSGWKKRYTWLIASVMGVLVECVQYMLPWRSFEVLDMLANTTGAAIGVLLAISSQKLLARYFPARLSKST